MKIPKPEMQTPKLCEWLGFGTWGLGFGIYQWATYRQNTAKV